MPAGLKSQVLNRIHDIEQKNTKIKMIGFGLSSILTAPLIFVVGQYLIELVAKTGFYEYVKLAFSGDAAVYTLWKELAYSLFESLPTISVITLLVVLVLFIWSFANTYTYVRKYSFLQA
jgi:hypothetical protein